MKPTYEELLAALERLATVADKFIPNEGLSNRDLNMAENVLNDAFGLIHHAKHGEYA